MKPDPAEPADQLNLLRQQLILAQVRIMELEDLRDTLAPRLQEVERLLTEAQALADRKLDETAHLEKTLQGLNHVYTETVAAHAAATTETARRLIELSETITRLQHELAELRSSRSWRWTAWLRSLGGKP